MEVYIVKKTGAEIKGVHTNAYTAVKHIQRLLEKGGTDASLEEILKGDYDFVFKIDKMQVMDVFD
jgi:hypothetical protein